MLIFLKAVSGGYCDILSSFDQSQCVEFIFPPPLLSFGIIYNFLYKQDQKDFPEFLFVMESLSFFITFTIDYCVLASTNTTEIAVVIHSVICFGWTGASGSNDSSFTQNCGSNNCQPQASSWSLHFQGCNSWLLVVLKLPPKCYSLLILYVYI